MMVLLKIAGQEHPDRHRPAEDIKQWMAAAVDTQLNQLFHTQFHQRSGRVISWQDHEESEDRRSLGQANKSKD